MKWFGLAGGLAFGASACVPSYKPPRADQPHAIVKVRRTYETTAGTNLREAVDVDEHAARSESVASWIGSAPRTDALLAHPVPGTFEVRSDFFHMETRMVRQSYQESRTEYRTESYDCSSGFGTSKNYRTCTRSKPHTVYETKYRNVLKQVEVSDGACAQAVRFVPRDGHVYLLQYTYHNHSVCSLSCFEQVQVPEGFQNLPCLSAASEED